MEKTKKTLKEQYEEIIANETLTEEQRDFLKGRVELLDKKKGSSNAKKSDEHIEIENSVEQTELIEEDITAKVFDIKVVETTLHEARLPECKAIKKQLINAWTMLETKVGSQLMYAAKILSNGLLVANGKTHLLIVYPTAQLCNHIMMPKHYENAKEVLKAALGKAYDFVALPDDTWKEKRLEYHDKFRVGDVYPELTPINNPKLRVVIRKDSPKTERELTLEKANDFFGDDE
jgi:hypothetical protein